MILAACTSMLRKKDNGLSLVQSQNNPRNSHWIISHMSNSSNQINTLYIGGWYWWLWIMVYGQCDFFFNEFKLKYTIICNIYNIHMYICKINDQIIIYSMKESEWSTISGNKLATVTCVYIS